MKAQDTQEDTSTAKQDARWAAVVARDANADGLFFFAVNTTGVCCRPSCASRRPRRENVVFFATLEDAKGAGFRPCRRCKPEQPSGAKPYSGMIAAACRQIQTSVKEPSLEDLANAANMSASHFHRIFRSALGLTPKQYARAHRDGMLRRKLAGARTVTEAIYDAGFNSSGRFYSTSNQVLGMTPSALRRGGEQAEIRFAIGACSLGSVLVAQSQRGVCAILLGDDPHELVRDLEYRFPSARIEAGDAAFDQLIAKVVGLIEVPGTGLGLPLDIRGTAFQQRVWQALRKLPVGATATYQEIAETIGMPKAVRAVAHACAANSLAVAVPCHRVIRRDGDISGYRWGVERKTALLQREALRDVPNASSMPSPAQHFAASRTAGQV